MGAMRWLPGKLTILTPGAILATIGSASLQKLISYIRVDGVTGAGLILPLSSWTATPGKSHKHHCFLAHNLGRHASRWLSKP